MTNTTNTPNGTIFSTSGTLQYGFDANGLPTVSLPVIALLPALSQSAAGDDAVIKAHDIQWCSVIDLNIGTGSVIDVVPAYTVRTYQASTNGVWRASTGRVLIGHTTTAPANTTTPVGWMEACTANGNVVGRIPIYE